jgi:hypothetical protein
MELQLFLWYVPDSGIVNMLKSQDVMVTALLAIHPHKAWSFQALGQITGLSQSAAFRAVQRVRASGLVVSDGFRVFDDRFVNFVEHGVPYVFATAPGKLARGVPTAHSAPPLNAHISASSTVVWPDAKGSMRGESLTPLAPTAAAAAQRDATLYHVLALIDALRIRRPREQKLAVKLLKEILGHARLVPEAG